MADETAARTDAVDEGPDSLAVGLWGLLQSVRTTIYVLPLLAIATTIGAVITQKRPPDYYDMAYGMRAGRIITALGFDNIYNSTWFIVLVCILLVNLAACVGRSFRRAARRYRGPAPEALVRKLDNPRAGGCWQAEASTSDLKTRLVSALHRARYAVTETSGAGPSTLLLARRRPLAHYGSIVMHLAIFLVALGAVLGCLPWTSLDRYITIAEGDTYVDEDGKLGFDVRLDDFRMEYYPGTDQPSSYDSDVVLLLKGTELKKGTATVNRQLTYHGVALGQSSWGLAGLRLSVTDPSGKAQVVQFPLEEGAGPEGQSAWGFTDSGRIETVGGGKAALVGVEFVPDIDTGSPYPRKPAASLQLVTGLDSGKHEFHDLGSLGLGEERSAQGYKVRFDEIAYASTLSARKDPGLPFVWAGFILVSLGMMVMFYVRPRAFLIEVSEGAKGRRGRVRVALTGRELVESDRRVIESACEASLSPMRATQRSTGRGRASS
jgi:cytochrome c biogenesis protein